jgi:NAD dependent epimerase/dehydratase family enzyme
MGRPSVAPVPGFVLRLVQGEFADEVLFSKRVLPKRLTEAGYRFGHPEVSGALGNLVGKETKDAAIPTGA